MLLSTNRIAQFVVFICAFSGIFVFGKLPVWIAFNAILLPILAINVLFHRPKFDFTFLLFTFTLVIVSFVNLYSAHVSTFLYSIFLCAVFLFSKRKIESCSTVELLNIFRAVILIFFILIILGLALYLALGISEFSLAKVDLSRGVPRSFGPSTEPSYAALTLTIAIWVICASKSNSVIGVRLLVAIYLASIIVIGSGIGYLVCIFFLINLFLVSNVKIFRFEKILVILTVCFFLPFLSLDIERLKPLLEIMKNFIISGSLWDLFEALKYADASAWFRFGPFVEYLQELNIERLNNFLLGNGAGNSTAYFGNKYIMHLEPEWFDQDGNPKMDLAFFPAFLFDYGAIATVIFLAFVWKLMKSIKGGIFLFPLAIFIFFNSNFNTSIFWFFIYALLVINIIQKKESIIEKN